MGEGSLRVVVIVRRDRDRLPEILLRECPVICKTLRLLPRHSACGKAGDIDLLRERDTQAVLGGAVKDKKGIHRLSALCRLHPEDLREGLDIFPRKPEGGVDPVIIHVLGIEIALCGIPHLLPRHLEAGEEPHGEEDDEEDGKIPSLLCPDAAARELSRSLSLSHHSSSSAFTGCELISLERIFPD